MRSIENQRSNRNTPVQNDTSSGFRDFNMFRGPGGIVQFRGEL